MWFTFVVAVLVVSLGLLVLMVMLALFGLWAIRQMSVDSAATDAMANAVWRGDVDGVRAALDNRADPDAVTEDGTPVLHVVVRSGSVEMVRALLAAGADVNAVDADGRTTLQVAVTEQSSNLIVMDLIMADASLRGARTYLDQATNETIVSVVEGALDVADTMLLEGVQQGATARIDAALALGADPNVTDGDGIPAVQHAMWLNRERLVRRLVAAGAQLPTPPSASEWLLFDARIESAFKRLRAANVSARHDAGTSHDAAYAAVAPELQELCAQGIARGYAFTSQTSVQTAQQSGILAVHFGAADNHPQAYEDTAQIIIRAARSAGLKAWWNGSPHTPVRLVFDATVSAMPGVMSSAVAEA